MGARGLARGLGPAAARQVRRPRRRHRDGLAVEQAAAAALRAGRGRRPGAARLPARLVGAAVRRAAGLDRGRGRARADRPARPPGSPATATASRSPRARRTRSAPATTRARSPPAGTERYDRVVATVPGDVFAQLLDPGLAAEVGEEYLGARARDRVLRRARAPARARPPASRPSTGPTWPTPSCPFVGLIEHANFLDPARYGGRRFFYVANYLPHGHELLALEAGEVLARYEPGPAQGQPGVLARLGQARRGASPSPPRSRSSRPATPAGSRRCARRPPGSCSPTRPRSIPRTAAPTTPCASVATRRSRSQPSGVRPR